jgi:oligogalacturonide lyase
MAAWVRQSRRRFLFVGLAASGLYAQRPKFPAIPSEMRRYQDPTTELDVFRLTDPQHSSVLPVYYNRAIARNSGSLVFASDRTGTLQPYRLDVKTGESHQLTEAAELDPSSLTYTPDSRSLVFFAGPTLHMAAVATGHTRELYQVPEGWERAPGMSVGPDGTHATFSEKKGDQSRLRTVTLGQGAARTVLQTQGAIVHPIHRPMRAQILYQGDESLWMVNADGQQKRQLKVAPGRCVEPNWSADGKTILYLNFPADPKQLHNIRELAPDGSTDKLVVKTSQFASFAFNRDASVFAGASANKASPTVLIVVRLSHSERTLCEHKASQPENATLFFAPDSQRIYFQSDREGKPAIYCLHVERLVEKTDETW